MTRLSFATLLLVPLLAACAGEDTNFDDVEAIAAAKVEICHLNNGAGEYAIIEVSENSLDSHLDHGDTIYTDEQSCECTVLYDCLVNPTFSEPVGGAGADTDECVTFEAADADCLSDFTSAYGSQALADCSPSFAFDCGLDTLANQNGCGCAPLGY